MPTRRHSPHRAGRRPWTQGWLRQLCRDAGAADVGLVEIDRPALGEEAANARRLFPRVRTLVSLVTMSNPDAIRSVSRATANVAWHFNDVELDEVTNRSCAASTTAASARSRRSIGFPMRHEPGQTTWEIAHKLVAVQAGMGHMGINRNVIHPRFGNFVLLETILIDADVDRPRPPAGLQPVQRLQPVRRRLPGRCRPHRRPLRLLRLPAAQLPRVPVRLRGLGHTIADGRLGEAYRSKFTGEETRSMWQSLGFGSKYKSAYCQAVCPAGDDVIGPYMADKAGVAARRRSCRCCARRRPSTSRRGRVPSTSRCATRPSGSATSTTSRGCRRRPTSCSASGTASIRTRAAGVSVGVQLRFAERAVLVTVEDGALVIAELDDRVGPIGGGGHRAARRRLHPAPAPRVVDRRQGTRRPTA